MKPIYLEEILIENFRTFGRFDIRVPPTPGLVLLVGSNGLGKSSFFDAIQWGLTGNVRRFSSYGSDKLAESDYLTREGAQKGSHSVRLSFTDRQIVERSPSVQTPASAISALLAREERFEVSDLGTYLALTHFLGQESKERFTSRDPREQWKALRGPSGIDRLERVRAGLRGRSTTMAFTRRLDDQEAALDRTKANIAQWQGWQLRLERLRDAAKASGALSSDEIIDRLDFIEALARDLGRTDATSIVGETIDQRIARVGKQLTTAEAKEKDHLAALSGLAGVAERYPVVSANAQENNPVLISAREDVRLASEALRAETSNWQGVEGTRSAQRDAIASLKRDIDLLTSTKDDVDRLSSLQQTLSIRTDERLWVVQAIESCQARHAEAESAIEAGAAAASEVARCRALVDRALQHVDAHADLVGQIEAIEENTLPEANAKVLIERGRLELRRLGEERNVLDGHFETATLLLKNAERHASQISGAVATIASLLKVDDHACPICRTEFSESGQLLMLAAEAANSSDTKLAVAAAAVEDLQAKRGKLNTRIEDIQSKLKEWSTVSKEQDARRVAANESHASLRRSLALRLDEEVETAVSERWTQANQALADAVANYDRYSASAAAASEVRSSIYAEIKSLKDRDQALSTELASLEEQTKACQVRISARTTLGLSRDELHTRIGDRSSALIAAEQHLPQIAFQVDVARERVARAKELVAIVERALSVSERACDEARHEAAALLNRWTRAKLRGTPSLAVLQEEISIAQERLSTLVSLRERIGNLSNASQIAMVRSEINDLLEQIRTVGGDTAILDPESYLERLKIEERKAKEDLELTRGVRSAVSRFTTQLVDRAESYSSQVLAPLNGVIREFNEAMLSSPGPSIQFKAEHRVDTTNFGMLLRGRDDSPRPATKADLPPQIVLSEGQLAANGFSILCAASAAYPWSKWPSLLLDDPLQHNDIIHTAAFIDVMRNLVEIKHYQLFMSSHDRGEADFIARKFDAAGLPCTTILLSGPSETGVLFEGPTYNRCATKIIDSQDSDARSA